MPSFTCTSCGQAFSLPDRVLERYPGWTPKTCRSCRDGGGSSGGSSGGTRGRRAGGTRSRRGAGRGPEPLPTVAQVLERYHDGPTDGVFTDGSAQPNPGPGGWGAVYVVGGEVVDQDWGHKAATTNNRMELTALVAGIDLVPAGRTATVYTDSRLVLDTVTRWAAGWERRGWRRKGGEIANLDLVKEAYERVRDRPELRVEWIAAHAGNRWNEYADALSTAYLRDEV